ncbi:hypothetical protein [Armatimonas sp.]|uniref:hypothetical protein n=1 Tax=Armatimonas sp. TaxID=1872638 RepID=UPI00374D1722
MSVVELEVAIQKLSSKELREFMSWFDTYRDEQWDNQIATDLKLGKLAYLIAEAKEASRNQKTRPLP